MLSTGGGVVTRDENYPLLHQNSQIVMLNRKLDELAHKGRPITARDGIDKLAEQRMPRYRAWARPHHRLARLRSQHRPRRP